jgi:hypothetical protein
MLDHAQKLKVSFVNGNNCALLKKIFFETRRHEWKEVPSSSQNFNFKWSPIS